jgi:uncharacterized protein YxjI
MEQRSKESMGHPFCEGWLLFWCRVKIVEGNWMDMNFQVLHQERVVGEVGKKWFSWGDSYRVQILEEEMETMILAVVIAIDCVKADQADNNTATF